MTPTWHKSKAIKTSSIPRVETKCPRLSFLEQAGHVHRAEAPPISSHKERHDGVQSRKHAKASKSNRFSKWRSSLRRDCGFSFQAENWQFGTPAAAVALVAPSFSEQWSLFSWFSVPKNRTVKPQDGTSSYASFHESFHESFHSFNPCPPAQSKKSNALVVSL